MVNFASQQYKYKNIICSQPERNIYKIEESRITKRLRLFLGGYAAVHMATSYIFEVTGYGRWPDEEPCYFLEPMDAFYKTVYWRAVAWIEESFE